MVRMDPDRLPRKLLFSWVEHPRRRGGQEMTFGKRVETTVKETLEACDDGNLRRIITGTGTVTNRRGAVGIGWVGLAKMREEWARFIEFATIKFSWKRNIREKCMHKKNKCKH